MIRHRTKDWVIQGNHQFIDGRVDTSEAELRGANESLEEEVLRLYPGEWEVVTEPAKNHR